MKMKTKTEIMELFRAGKAIEYLVTFIGGFNAATYQATIIGTSFEEAYTIWGGGSEYIEYTQDQNLIKKFNDKMNLVEKFND